ncbi:hypothetical protein V1264_001848 [Littorina saxatilis]|uniref:Uncharacterized protein n=1 Tax=Littorina saxatilis TaxID=31220 RepID=A0AAN9GRD6_9CAEN
MFMQREIIRLEPPHGTCDYRGSTTDLYTKNYNTTYSKLSCLKSCYQTIVNRYCNCSWPMYYISDTTNVCNLTDHTVDTCTAGLTSAVPDEYATCDALCPQPCNEVEYDMLSSSAAWPSEKYENYLINKLKQSNYLLMDGKDADNFVKLNVYFKDLMYEKVEQQKAYESESLISDIGGQLGLWLGLSAITIGEICGLLLSLFRSLSSIGPKKDDDTFDTPVKPFSKDLEPATGGMMLNDVKSRGFV